MIAKSVLFVLGFAAMATNALAQDSYNVGSLQISQPWTRATPKGASTAAGYLKITNTGTTADRLVGGSSPIAGRVEVHEMSMDKGVMKMRLLKDGLEIKPGASVDLKPGSYHLMLVDLKQPIKKGDHIKDTLTFEKAGSVDIELTAVGTGETFGKGSGAGKAMQQMPGMAH
jgi:copper(I)-binding protein